MRLTFSGRFSVKVLAIIFLIVGASFIVLRAVQTPPRDAVSYVYPSPALFSKDGIRVYVDRGPQYIVDAFRRAVEDWDKAVSEFNSMKDLECSFKMLTGCRACLTEPRLPRIKISELIESNVIVEFRDSMPKRNVVAYTEPYINGSLLARIVVWSLVPEHRAYQVALHEIARLYGIDIPRVYRTLFGAVPAGSNTRELNPSMEQFMNGPPDPMKPTTLDTYTAYAGLKNLGAGRIELSGIVFRAYDEPDFTVPAFISPALIVLGLYILSKKDVKPLKRWEGVREAC